MPLDPLVKAFLDQAAMIPRPKMWQLPPQAARASFAGMMGLVGPQNVAIGKVENFTDGCTNKQMNRSREIAQQQ